MRERVHGRPRRRPTGAAGILLILLAGALACGRYGPPVRTWPAPADSPAATAAPERPEQTAPQVEGAAPGHERESGLEPKDTAPQAPAAGEPEDREEGDRP